MIPRETIDRIYAAARIEEVVGDYVSLKKRGANLIGL
jgi:DNA primase